MTVFAVTNKTTNVDAAKEVERNISEAIFWCTKQVNLLNGSVTKEEFEGANKVREALVNSKALEFCRMFSERAANDPKLAKAKALVDTTLVRANLVVQALDKRYGTGRNPLVDAVRAVAMFVVNNLIGHYFVSPVLGYAQRTVVDIVTALPAPALVVGGAAILAVGYAVTKPAEELPQPK